MRLSVRMISQSVGWQL